MSTEKRSAVRRWIRRGFIVWALVSTAWLLNSFRTQGVAPALLNSDQRVAVDSLPETLTFRPTSVFGRSGLVFVVGGGVAAEAYAPLLRPLAESGHPVFVVRLPYRLAPLERHKRIAVNRVRAILKGSDKVDRWVIAGHSLGAALACRLAMESLPGVAAIVLIGSSHPKTIDLSQSRTPITKVFASNDGVATVALINETRHLLPADTGWVEIEGGNHSQFGHYGHQLFDGSPTISRERQQDMTRAVLRRALGSTAREDA